MNSKVIELWSAHRSATHLVYWPDGVATSFVSHMTQKLKCSSPSTEIYWLTR